MPLLTTQSLKEPSIQTLTMTQLDGSDTFQLQQTGIQSLIINNDSGGNITFTMIGDEAPATTNCSGIGSVDVVAESVTVNDGSYAKIYLSNLSLVLKGLTTITGGTGLKVALVNY